MNRAIAAALAATLFALAGCKQQGAEQAGKPAAAVEVLPGSASDAMIRYDTLRSQPPAAIDEDDGFGLASPADRSPAGRSPDARAGGDASAAVDDAGAGPTPAASSAPTPTPSAIPRSVRPAPATPAPSATPAAQ